MMGKSSVRYVREIALCVWNWKIQKSRHRPNNIYSFSLHFAKTHRPIMMMLFQLLYLLITAKTLFSASSSDFPTTQNPNHRNLFFLHAMWARSADSSLASPKISTSQFFSSFLASRVVCSLHPWRWIDKFTHKRHAISAFSILSLARSWAHAWNEIYSLASAPSVYMENFYLYNKNEKKNNKAQPESHTAETNVCEKSRHYWFAPRRKKNNNLFSISVLRI